MIDCNLLYSIFRQLLECIWSGNKSGALDCLELMRKEIENEDP